ncbi:MAG: biotin--[acetyl-CoA-carboxylase] ligase, partial [Candidatus Bipolaricaulota bacterium]|nr:biotin--[acetyl-CoA-carboxylase] ligase [Candidatus Bipolaricaulota bacterium]
MGMVVTLGRRISVFDQLGSTNDYLKQLAESGAPEGTVVIAREQTAGRGRLGRSWLSPQGGAWFSLLLRPPIPVEQAGCISVLIAISLARALREHWGVPVGVKWPNDLYVPHPQPLYLSLPLSACGEGTGEVGVREGGPQAGVRYQKLGGILIELSTNAAQIEWLVAGIGININNQLPAGVPATSLARELGHPVPLEDFFERALTALAHDYERFLSEGFAFVHAHWQRLSVLPPRILVKTNSGEIAAEVLGLAPSGRLI